MAIKKVEPDGIDKLLFLVSIVLILVSGCCITVSFFKPLSKPIFEQVHGVE